MFSLCLQSERVINPHTTTTNQLLLAKFKKLRRPDMGRERHPHGVPLHCEKRAGFATVRCQIAPRTSPQLAYWANAALARASSSKLEVCVFAVFAKWSSVNSPRVTSSDELSVPITPRGRRWPPVLEALTQRATVTGRDRAATLKKARARDKN